MTVAAGATFNAQAAQSDRQFPIRSLAGGGAVEFGANSLTVGITNESTAFSGVISGSGGLTKIGTGTFTLSNARYVHRCDRHQSRDSRRDG